MTNSIQQIIEREAEGRIEGDIKEVERKHQLLTSRIIDGMKANNLNKGQFASKMNVQPSIITRWLSGHHNFTIETLIKIEQNLSIKLLNV